MRTKKIISSFLERQVSPILNAGRVAYVPFVQDWNGLGNRIKGLCNFYASLPGLRRVVLLWNVKQWVTARFADLFTLRNVKVVEINNGLLYSSLKFVFRRFLPNGLVREERPFWSFILPHRLERPEFAHVWSFSQKSAYSVDWWFDRTPSDVREFFLPFFENLMPSAAVLRRVDVVIPGGGYLDAVSVQIRNTGLQEDAKDVCRVETILKVMDGYGPNQTFFISCMNASISKIVKDKFGARVFELPDKDYGSMVDAVADMYILGRCKEMIASPRSTFSEVAWWWGGARIKVVMLENEYNQRNL